MKNNFLNKRIPTVFALFILLGGLVITSLLIQQGVFTVSQASPQEEPRNVHILNKTSDSFTLAFTTNAPTTAAINIQSVNPPRLVYDKRDSSGKTEFTTHFITVDNLTPDTLYDFSIISNGKNYLDSGKLYTVKTGNNTQNASDTYPLAGQILLQDGSEGKDVLVLVTIDGAVPAGAVTDDQGNYRISAQNIRSSDTNSPLQLEQSTPIEISAIQKEAVSNASYNYIPGSQIPPITLTQNYSFIASDEDVIVSTDEASLLALPTKKAGATSLSIQVPKPNQSFTDSRPQFRGTAAPNTIVKVFIDANPDIEAQIKSDSQGNWAFRPSAIIAQGKRRITVTQSQPFLQRSTSFEIFPSGSQIAQSATPSATLTPAATATLTPTSTPIPSASPTAVQTISTSPTPSTLVTPTAVLLTSAATPAPTTFTQATITPNQQTLPPTGDNTTALVLTTLSILFIVTGSAFLFML